MSALAAICVEKFQQQTNAAAKLIAFNKASSSCYRRSLTEKGGLDQEICRSRADHERGDTLSIDAEELISYAVVAVFTVEDGLAGGASGFEPSVPYEMVPLRACIRRLSERSRSAKGTRSFARGTESSNPVSSASESALTSGFFGCGRRGRHSPWSSRPHLDRITHRPS